MNLANCTGHDSLIVLLSCAVLMSTGCSTISSGKNDASVDGTGGAEQDGSGGGASGGRTGSGGTALGGENAGGAGGESEGPPDVSCAAVREAIPGENYGDYSLFALRMEAAIPPGIYSVRIGADDPDVAYVFNGEDLVDEFSFEAQVSLADNALRTVAFEDFFEFDFRSQVAADLTGLSDSWFDGCTTITVEAAPQILAGQTYGAFEVESLTVAPGAPSGVYTFFTESGNTGSVDIRLDGVTVDTLVYDWVTTIGGDETFTFEFPGVVDITVGRPGGMSNLFGVAAEIFDGRHELSVPAP